MNQTPYVVLFCTTGSNDEAAKIANHLVERHLAACVNILPSVQSVYRWKNQITSDTELMLIIKSEESRIPDIEKAIRSIHSYETPELIALNVTYGLPEYLQWLGDSLGADET